jgi:hypothetical protein
LSKSEFVPIEDSIFCALIAEEFKLIIPELFVAVVMPLFKYKSPLKFKVPFALYEMLFKGLREVPIEFAMSKLMAGVEKLILPKAPVVVMELKVFAESTIKEPPPIKFTLSLVAIEEALTFDKFIVVVADSAGRI